LQAVFVVLLALVGAVAVGAGIYFMRDVWKRYRVAYIGIIYLGVFVVIRAASFHHIDTLLYHLPVMKYWVNTILELGGIGIVGYAAYTAATQKYGMKYRAFETRVRVR
jgi:drug/metabolite transporter (DMT)-like permease